MPDTPELETKRPRRRSKWVPGELQLKVTLTTFCVAGVAVLFFLQLSLFGLSALLDDPDAAVQGAIAQAKKVILTRFAIVGVATIPLSFLSGLMFFKVVGPLHRLKRHLQSLVDGRWDRRCRLRSGDELQDVNEALNSAMDAMRQTLEDQQRLLEEARAVLAETPGPSEERTGELIAAMETQAAQFAKRLGKEPAAASTTPVEA